MTNEQLLVIKNGLRPQASSNFSTADANTAAIKALCEAAGISTEASLKEVRRNAAAFAIIEEAIDEMLPADLQNVFGQFAEVKTFARDAEVVYKTEKVGKRRARLSVTKGARGGIYKAARLDNRHFQMETSVYTVAVYVTLEDIILGTYTLGELYSNVLDGFEQIVYKDTITALQSAKNVAPSANSFVVGTGSGQVALETALDSAIQIVRAYGDPVIVGFRKAISAINNMSTVTGSYPNRPTADVDDIRHNGFVQLYKGVPVVEIPNYLEDETNSAFIIGDTEYMFVLPADAKPVKIAFKGELELVENKQATGSEKWEAHKIMGVGVALANNICTIKAY